MPRSPAGRIAPPSTPSSCITARALRGSSSSWPAGRRRGARRSSWSCPVRTPPAGIRKRLTVNGVARRSSSVGETARAVLFRPEEMLLLVGSPSERRRFLDGIVAQRDRRSAHDLVEAARILAQRNALLRAIRAEEADLDTPRLLGRAARRGRGAGHARAAGGRARHRGADRALARRRCRADRARRIGVARRTSTASRRRGRSGPTRRSGSRTRKSSWLPTGAASPRSDSARHGTA